MTPIPPGARCDNNKTRARPLAEVRIGANKNNGPHRLLFDFSPALTFRPAEFGICSSSSDEIHTRHSRHSSREPLAKSRANTNKRPARRRWRPIWLVSRRWGQIKQALHSWRAGPGRRRRAANQIRECFCRARLFVRCRCGAAGRRAERGRPAAAATTTVYSFEIGRRGAPFGRAIKTRRTGPPPLQSAPKTTWGRFGRRGRPAGAGADSIRPRSMCTSGRPSVWLSVSRSRRALLVRFSSAASPASRSVAHTSLRDRRRP
jgi:hypothetical protein